MRRVGLSKDLFPFSLRDPHEITSATFAFDHLVVVFRSKTDGASIYVPFFVTPQDKPWVTDDVCASIVVDLDAVVGLLPLPASRAHHPHDDDVGCCLVRTFFV